MSAKIDTASAGPTSVLSPVPNNGYQEELVNYDDETTEGAPPRCKQELKSGRTPGRITRRHVKEILAATGLLIGAGAMETAQADTTLYTSATRGGRLSCIAVNVGKKPLTITISIIDGTGTTSPLPVVLAGPTAIVTNPGIEASLDLGDFADPSSEGYCVFQVSGTGNRDDVRAVLVSNKVGTQPTPPPTQPQDGTSPYPYTSFPYFITRALEAQ
jgi:hypothetical protein